MENRTMPRNTIIPVLEYEDVPGAIRWLSDVFGFTERWHVGDHRAQLSFEGGTIVAVKQGKIKNIQSLLVRVKDLDRHYERARQSGARIVQAPADFPYGERQYAAEDPNGHQWTFSQSIRDLMPEDWGGVTNVLD